MNKLIMAIACSSVLLAGSAAAQVYVGVGAGGAKTDTNETSWKVYGGYQFTPNWGAELAYTNLGSNHGADVESWSVAGTGTLPLDPHWSLFGKLGAAQNRAHFLDAGAHTDLLIGIGASYAMTKEVSLRLEYEEFGKLSNVGYGDNSNGKNLGLSLKYGF